MKKEVKKAKKKPIKAKPSKQLKQAIKENEDALKGLNERQKVFCREYVFDFNGSRAYKIAYPDTTEDSSRVLACNLLTNINIKEYIKEIQKDMEALSGISKLRVLREWEKQAFTSIADLHNTWIEKKAFEELTQEQKACISEIIYQTKTVLINEVPTEIEYVKLKLHDKGKALENIAKLLGFNAAEKQQHEFSEGNTIQIKIQKKNG